MFPEDFAAPENGFVALVIMLIQITKSRWKGRVPFKSETAYSRRKYLKCNWRATADEDGQYSFAVAL